MPPVKQICGTIFSTAAHLVYSRSSSTHVPNGLACDSGQEVDVFLTISDRKRGEAERRSKAAGALRDLLAEHARRLGGRYILYGSAAKGTMTHDSDIDLLLDFPDETEAEAWRAAETECEALGMAHDIMPLRWSKGRLKATVEATGLSLA